MQQLSINDNGEPVNSSGFYYCCLVLFLILSFKISNPIFLQLLQLVYLLVRMYPRTYLCSLFGHVVMELFLYGSKWVSLFLYPNQFYLCSSLLLTLLCSLCLLLCLICWVGNCRLYCDLSVFLAMPSLCVLLIPQSNKDIFQLFTVSQFLLLFLFPLVL